MHKVLLEAKQADNAELYANVTLKLLLCHNVRHLGDLRVGGRHELAGEQVQHDLVQVLRC